MLTQIPFRERIAWVLRFFPNLTGVYDTDYFIVGPGARTFVGLSLNCRQVPLFDVMRCNGSSLFVAGLPTRQAQTFANAIATFAPIIAGVTVNQESVWRHRIKFHRE